MKEPVAKIVKERIEDGFKLFSPLYPLPKSAIYG